MVSRFSRVRLLATLWAVARQASLMGFSRLENWSGLLFPFPRDPPNPGVKPESLMSPPLAGRFFITSTSWDRHLGAQIPALPLIEWVSLDKLLHHRYSLFPHLFAGLGCSNGCAVPGFPVDCK